jgi:glycosyltransferase involved in cell wall biosynthesis
LVNWLQDVYPEVARELDTPLVRGRVGRWLKGLRNVSLRDAEANVVIGQVMAERLEAEGICPARVTVIPNWADEQALRPIPTIESVARKKWRFEPGDFVLGYSGTLGRAHECETLLAAARLLARRHDVKFLFVGGGHEYARLEGAVREEGLAGFTFRPHQPRDRLEDTLGAADAHWISLRPELEGLIVPSKFYGILAAGRPVVAVASPDGEIGRIVADTGCGFAIEPGDADGLARAIETVADDPILRRTMAERARQASECRFPRASALERWTELIQSVGTSQLRAPIPAIK